MPDHKTSQKHLDLGIELYEAKIADKSITASEMGIYLKLLEKRGWERPEIEATQAPMTDSLPVNVEEEIQGDDRIIKFR